MHALNDLRGTESQSEQLEYWLRRAEQESIAAIRATSAVASQCHDAMAQAYSALARGLLN